MSGKKREFLNIIYSVVLLTVLEGCRRKHTPGWAVWDWERGFVIFM